MNSIRRQLATFGAVLAGLYAVGVIAGQFIDAKPHGGGTGTHANSKAHVSEDDAEAAPVRGLAVAENGLRLVVSDPEHKAGATKPLRFHVVDSHGDAVRDFDVTHERRMHLIVARRDLAGFQHLHPTMADDGTWSTELKLDDPGSYLGAGGHLVALREGDLAFLHVHPSEHTDDEVAFATTFPTQGRYRLFLQFQHGGRVQTAAFTHDVP